MSCAGTTKAAPAVFFLGVFAAVCVNMGFILVFLINEIQADLFHVVSLHFLLFTNFVFELTGWWDVSKVPFTSVMCVCVCVCGGGAILCGIWCWVSRFRTVTQYGLRCWAHLVVKHP